MKEKGSKLKPTCEFCNASHETAKTCEMRVGDLSCNSEEGARTLKYRDVLNRVEHNRDLIIGVIFRENTKAEMKQLEPELDDS